VSGPGPVYVCGHSAGELARLATQSAVFREITEEALVWGGVACGMRVLDIGCGAGDMALAVAARVGPTGHVIGVDRVPEAVATARRRCAADGVLNAEFHQSAIDAIELAHPVDALVGRFVLMHQSDPAAILRSAARHVRAGGVILMLESNLAGALPGVRAWPEAPLFGAAIDWMIAVIRNAGALPDMGLRLHRTFQEAGLPAPRLRQHAHLFAGEGAAGLCDYIAASVHSMLPVAAGLGMQAPPSLEVNTLARRLAAEAASLNALLSAPPVIVAAASRD
jgi:ubiquinone/menaquinone biosynthesis C-methylase UbiE